MPDGVVGIRQHEAPDRLVDNAVYTNDSGLQVYRQKIDAPTMETTLARRLPQTAYQFATGLYRVANIKQNVGTAATGVLGLRNPTGSGKRLTITEFSVAVNGRAEVRFYFDATLTAPTVQASWNPNRAYEPANLPTAGVVESATGFTGGVLRASYPMREDDKLFRPFTVVLNPGMSVQVVATSTVAAFDLYASATWIEESLI